MASTNPPLKLSPANMYMLAAFAILEGSPDLRNTHEQLKVAAVVVNRTNASNWVREFGAGVQAQLFAPGQFEVQTRYGLDLEDFGSFETAVKAVADAKPGLSEAWARELMLAFMRDAADATKYEAAATEIGDSTGFRGNGSTNTFRKESRWDDANLGSKQPSSIVVDWPKGATPLF
ncbi:MAG: cell wall hydrolase [Myxococcales bacterium]|nr:cell wall hydrolase [Myxococcales bacterium]